MKIKKFESTFEPDGIAVMSFRLHSMNERGYKRLSADQKAAAFEWLEKCSEWLQIFKDEINQDLEIDRRQKIIEAMQTTPIMGKTLSWIGFTNDSMGEIFEPEAMYKAVKNEGGDNLIVIKC